MSGSVTVTVKGGVDETATSQTGDASASSKEGTLAGTGELSVDAFRSTKKAIILR